MLHDGLYEKIINKGVEKELAGLDKLRQTASIDTGEAFEPHVLKLGKYDEVRREETILSPCHKKSLCQKLFSKKQSSYLW